MIGRPIQHLASNLLYDEFISDIRNVLDTLNPSDVHVQLRDGIWYLLRIRIYRSLNSAVEGLILIFTDLAEHQHSA